MVRAPASTIVLLPSPIPRYALDDAKLRDGSKRIAKIPTTSKAVTNGVARRRGRRSGAGGILGAVMGVPDSPARSACWSAAPIGTVIGAMAGYGIDYDSHDARVPPAPRVGPEVGPALLGPGRPRLSLRLGGHDRPELCDKTYDKVRPASIKGGRGSSDFNDYEDYVSTAGNAGPLPGSRLVLERRQGLRSSPSRTVRPTEPAAVVERRWPLLPFERLGATFRSAEPEPFDGKPALRPVADHLGGGVVRARQPRPRLRASCRRRSAWASGSKGRGRKGRWSGSRPKRASRVLRAARNRS